METVLNPFKLDKDVHSNIGEIKCLDDSLTAQADKESADINYIVRQFGLTHQLPYGRSVPKYDDFSDVPNDFHAAMNFIRESEDAFMVLPAEVRTRFNNDPASLLDFVQDEGNYDEAVKLGIVIDNRPVEPPVDVTGDQQAVEQA